MNPAYIFLFAVIIFLVFSFFLYEKSHPSAKELVVVAVLSAFAVFARAAFAFIPYFNPVFALIMLSGLCLGVRQGFVIGALCAFAGNFIFGQGPWTFYQMFSYGICGGFFGIFKGIPVKQNKNGEFERFSSIKNYFFYSALSFFFIVLAAGPVLDLSGFFMTGIFEWNYLRTILLAGLPFNIAGGISTVITIILLGRRFCYTVDRTVRRIQAS